MVVVVRVRSANELLWNGVAKENAENAVLGAVGFVFIESDENQGVLHELLVLQKRTQEILQPDTSNSDGSVMTVRGHVGSNKQPLRKLIRLEILVEHGEVLYLGGPLLAVHH